MANEAVLMVELELPIMMTVDNTEAIPKGTLLELVDPFTASAHDGDEDKFAGVAAEEKIANDGKTKIAVYRRGIFKMTCVAAIATIGAVVALSATANKVKISDATCLSSIGLGTALEVTGGADETFLVDLNIGIGGAIGLS